MKMLMELVCDNSRLFMLGIAAVVVAGIVYMIWNRLADIEDRLDKSELTIKALLSPKKPSSAKVSVEHPHLHSHSHTHPHPPPPPIPVIDPITMMAMMGVPVFTDKVNTKPTTPKDDKPKIEDIDDDEDVHDKNKGKATNKDKVDDSDIQDELKELATP